MRDSAQHVQVQMQAQQAQMKALHELQLMQCQQQQCLLTQMSMCLPNSNGSVTTAPMGNAPGYALRQYDSATSAQQLQQLQYHSPSWPPWQQMQGLGPPEAPVATWPAHAGTHAGVPQQTNMVPQPQAGTSQLVWMPQPGLAAPAPHPEYPSLSPAQNPGRDLAET